MKNPIDPFEHPYVFSGYNYAIGVVSGTIPNCVYIVGACKRFLSDFEKCQDGNYKFKFDIDRAERYLKLVQKFQHVKGQWDTENIQYLPWQNFCFMNIIGFRHRKTNFPRFRIAHVEVPRGQGKSAIASQAVLYFLALDNPKGNEISTAATKVDQARIVLDSARAMAKSSKQYLDATGVEVQAHRIIHDESNSFVRALSSDDKSLDGLNDVLCTMDELHAVDRSLFDVIYSGMSKRRDSLLLCITTAGFSTDSVGYSQSEYAKKVATGEMPDEQFFSLVYTIDRGDDLFSEDTWRKANPSYGHSVDPVTFEAKAFKAKVTPADLPNFKVKHLNIWLSESRAFFDLDAFDRGANPELSLEHFRGKKCFVGIDLASKIDLASLTLIFREEGKYYFFHKTYIPEKTVEQAQNDVYANAIGDGSLIATIGEAINYPRLQEDFIQFSKDFNIIAAHYDPWNATQFAQECSKHYIEMVEFRMSTANLSEATKSLDAAMREGKFIHQGHAIVRWCFGNVVCKEDAAGNIYPRKNNDRLKIDISVSAIMAFAGWVNSKDETSIYESQGIRFF